MIDPNNNDNNDNTNNNENNELLKWNLLQLETKEILSECYFPTKNKDDNNDITSSSLSSTSTSNYKTLLNMQEYKESIKNILDKLPSHKSLVKVDNNTLSYLKSDLYKKYKSEWDISYDKSSMFDGIKTIGSYEHNTMTTSYGNGGNIVPTIDIAFMLNEKFWKDKDYLNYRYYDKRNLMILHIGQYLSKKKFMNKIGNVQLSYLRNDVRKLVLLISPPTISASKKKLKIKFQIRILVGGTSFPFPYCRLFPNCNNLPKESNSNNPTNIYNHGIIEDFSYVDNDKTVQDTISSSEVTITNFEESLILLKVWSSTRGLRNAHDGLTSYELTMIMIYCYRTKKISRGMTILQVFTTVLHFIKELFHPSNSKKKYIIMPSSNHDNNCDQELSYQKEYKNTTLLQGYKENNNNEMQIPIFLNEQRTMNIFTRFTVTSYKLIYHHISHTCNSQKSWNVQSLFLQSKRFWNIYDCYLQISKPKFNYKAIQDQIPLNYIDIGNKEEYTMQCICYILSHALNDRISLIRPYTTGNGVHTDDIPIWSLDSKPPKCNQYVIGIQFNNNNNEALTRMVDKCDDTKNKELFQFIFGDKIEVRI